MQDSPSLPFLAKPRDPLRDGIVTLKDEAKTAHPVEIIQDGRESSDIARLEMLKNVYGTALPARMQIEKQILNKIERLPGLPSSKLGYDSLTGSLDDFSFDSYLSLPGDSEAPAPDLHTVMEKRLGINK